MRGCERGKQFVPFKFLDELREGLFLATSRLSHELATESQSIERREP